MVAGTFVDEDILVGTLADILVEVVDRIVAEDDSDLDLSLRPRDSSLGKAEKANIYDSILSKFQLAIKITT